MAITLTPALAAAQDSITGRHPIIKMLATQAQDSIPFDGEYFNGSSIKEEKNILIPSVSSAMVGLFIRNGVNIVQVRTDDNRTFWTESVSPVNYGTIQNIAAAELVDGNIGIVYTVGRVLRRTVLDGSSNVVSASAIIQTLVSPETPLDPAVVRLADGSFLLAYIVYNSTAETYQIRTRTSADFLTWSAASNVTLLGLLNTRTIANLAMIHTTGGETLLFFDYVDFEKDEGLTTISNVYYILSADSGATWGAPVQVTTYTEWGTSCINPFIAERTNGDLALAYTDERKVLTANSETLLWPVDCEYDSYVDASSLHFNPATHRLYVYQVHYYSGYRILCGIVVIDTESWEVVQSYTTQTSPGYNDIFKNDHVWAQKDRGDGEYIVFSTAGNTKVLCVINDIEETITEYSFSSNPDLEITCNVDVTWPYYKASFDTEYAANIKATWADATAKRVYVLLANGYIYFRSTVLGYIDLTETIDAATGKYPFHVILSTADLFTDAQVDGMGQMIVVPERNCIIVLANSSLPTWSNKPGKTTVIDMLSGEILKEFAVSTHSSYPHGGVHHACYYDGCLYGSFDYVTIDDQENHRGMVKINLDTEEITYYQPSWATVNEYNLIQKVPTGDGRILVAVDDSIGGVASFDIESGAWTLYDQNSVQGFSDGNIYSVAYDAENGRIMTGAVFVTTGVQVFDEDGSFNKGKLTEGINSGGWVWGTPEDLTLGRAETNQAVAVDQENILWSTWTRLDGTELSAVWDRDVKEKTLADYLVDGQPVTLGWSVDKTGTLSFAVSHGHLFDPNNRYSTWSEFLKKGKQIEVSLGERIGGIDYWQPQGKYIVDALHIDYVRGQYPTMKVDCVSPDFIWGDIEIPATTRYDTNAPEQMTTSLLMDHANINAGSIAIPDFPNSHEIHHQWVDVDFQAIISAILDHFQCVPYFDMDGIFAPKVIDLEQSVSHAYVGSEIIRFTPDDNYSSFTNRVVVTGEGLYFLEVTYAEELMETIMGSCGWWDNDTKVVRVNYSTDLDRVCYDPRLVVLASIKDFKILWSRSGGDEYLSLVDPNNRYCEITIILPGIMDVLIAAIALLLIVGAIAISCTQSCGPYIFALSVVSAAINYILGQVASYSYEVYAKPTGEEKQIVSAQVDDTEFQALLGGLVVTETFDDPFCYTTQSCREVAEHEMAIVQAQRSRLSFEKIAHLQDEICDRIQIEHPYSGAVIDVFITDLQRTYTKPDGSSTVGGVIDTITGWRL